MDDFAVVAVIKEVGLCVLVLPSVLEEGWTDKAESVLPFLLIFSEFLELVFKSVF